MDCRTALQIILEHVDYLDGKCQPEATINDVLPKEVLILAHEAMTQMYFSFPYNVEDLTMRIIKIEYIPQPKQDVCQRIPIVYMEDVHGHK